MSEAQNNARPNMNQQHRPMGRGPMGGGFGAPVEKAKNFKGTFVRLVKYLSPHAFKLVIVLIFTITSTVFAIFTPKMTGNGITKIMNGVMAKGVIDGITKSQTAPSIEEIQKMTAAQIIEMKQLAANAPKLPLMKYTKTADQKAEIFVQMMKFVKSLSPAQLKAMKIPSSFTSMKQKDIDTMANAIRETNGSIDFKYLEGLVLLLFGLYILSALCTFIQQFMMSTVVQRTVYDLRKAINDKLALLPLKYFDSRPHGEILSRVTNDVDTISTTLQQSVTQVISSVVQIIGYIIMMLTISWQLTLIILATLPLYVFSTMFITKRSQKYFAAQQKEIGDLSGHVEEMYTGHKIVKAFGYEEKSIETFMATNDRLYDAAWKAQFVSGIMFPLMNFVSNISYVLICVVGGMFVTNRLLNLGDITAFIQYSRQFTMPIVQTANIANIIQSTVACAERVFEVLDETEEEKDRADFKVLEAPEGSVKFENVDFSYKKDQKLIENMNINVKQGDTVAIVGPTGAGKTTLVNLLMRFYELEGGKILVDGVDIKDLERSKLRSIFGMVLQDTWLFNGTIRDNIAYGRENATEEEIIAAAKAAHADHFVRTLPEGYDTILNEEASNISQGQKQLLTIARAILADPVILILDEATSSVDTRTELIIQKAMAFLMKGRTNFVIAHRLSTIRDAETILVMKDGSIIEKGTHKGLLAENGFYADLYNSQFKGTAIEETPI
jgi:ATP-binding cassette subfamily B multidrug efflux pump